MAAVRYCGITQEAGRQFASSLPVKCSPKSNPNVDFSSESKAHLNKSLILVSRWVNAQGLVVSGWMDVQGFVVSRWLDVQELAVRWVDIQGLAVSEWLDVRGLLLSRWMDV